MIFKKMNFYFLFLLKKEREKWEVVWEVNEGFVFFLVFFVRKIGRRSLLGSFLGVWSYGLELTEYRCDRRFFEGVGW